MIDPKYPYLGASPDGYVKCKCCGPEVKYPYSCRNKSFLEASYDSGFCLEVTPVQLQIKICKVGYCDFVIWRNDEIVVLRITLDEEFLNEAIKRAITFYKYGVLPELVGKWYTKSASMAQLHAIPEGNVQSSHESSASNSERRWCYCKKEKEGELIGCDNSQCSIEWFHTTCLKITTIQKVNGFAQIVKRRK